MAYAQRHLRRGVFCAKSPKSKLAKLEDKMRSGERQRKFGLLATVIVGLLVGIPGLAKADVKFKFNTIDVPLCGPYKGATPPRTSVNGNSVNAIVGDFDDSAGNTHGFILMGGVCTPIDFRGATFTQVNGINASGQLVGTYVASSVPRAFFFSGSSFTDPNNYKTLSPPNSTRSQAGFINAQGQVNGVYRTPTPTPAGQALRHGFLWQSGSGFIAPPTPINVSEGGMEIDVPEGTTLFGINDPGQMVGTYVDIRGNRHGFFRDTAGNYTTLDAPGSTLTVAEGINNSGEIVGLYNDVGGNQHGFVLSGIGNYKDPSAWTTIDVPGAVDTQVFSINASGQIAGAYDAPVGKTTTQHGFIGTPEQQN
jgi:uncharacterized membrane protein